MCEVVGYGFVGELFEFFVGVVELVGVGCVVWVVGGEELLFLFCLIGFCCV